MDDMQKSYQTIANEENARLQAGGKTVQHATGGGGLSANPADVFKQYEQQAVAEGGNPAGSDGALMMATQLVFQNVIRDMDPEQVAGLTASDAAAMLFGNPEAAGEFGPDFDAMDPAGKMQLLQDIAGAGGDGDAMMEQEQKQQADQMQMQ